MLISSLTKFVKGIECVSNGYVQKLCKVKIGMSLAKKPISLLHLTVKSVLIQKLIFFHRCTQSLVELKTNSILAIALHFYTLEKSQHNSGSVLFFPEYVWCCKCSQKTFCGICPNNIHI